MISLAQRGAMELEYKIIEKEQFLFVSLKGKINKANKEKFEQCLKDCLLFPDRTVVVLFKDIHSVEISMNRDFTLFQHELRNKNKGLFLVGLKLQLKEELANRGLLRVHELKNSLEDFVDA